MDVIYFYGHRPTKSPLKEYVFSQWYCPVLVLPFRYPTQFVDDKGNKYCCAEQYMMAQKAMAFGRADIYEEIISQNNKVIGKESGFGRLQEMERHKIQNCFRRELLQVFPKPRVGRNIVGNR